ncbi:MAG: class IV adenylate cyclase [Blastocatellia bacterium]|nr:class IV adenylate cyclase [Blastocatellia bacterium]MDQ3221603.1 class IV adenylate cyclase [Acidobacteriota bacterium]
MAIEIEKKYRLNEENRRFVLKALEQVGAVFTGEDFEENIIYNGGALNKRNAILRIRKTQNKTLFTYKERVGNQSGIKHQIEHETEAADAGSLISIVETLGFKALLTYEKRRKTWMLRNAEVVIDELPFGLFMEIEGSITAIKEAEMFLDIEDFEVELETYPSITARLGVPKNGVIEARFN